MIHICLSTFVVSLFPIAAWRPPSGSGEVGVSVGPTHLSVASSNASSPGPQHAQKFGKTSSRVANTTDVNAEDHLEDPDEEGHVIQALPSTVSMHHTLPHSRKIRVVAVTDKPRDQRLLLLKRSLRSGGFSADDLQVVTTNNFTWTERLQLEQQMVQDAAYEDPEAVFLFVDAFDVFALGSPAEILDKFHRTGRDALFSCVTYPYPHQCDGFDWKQDGQCNKVSNWGAQCPHWCRFACAGAFMGKAGALAKIFAENPVVGSSDDQCYFNMVLAKSRYNIALDYRHEVFFSTVDLLQCSLERKGGRLRTTNTGTLPSIIHFDATHPTAEHLQSFWIDTLNGADGPVCASNNSCTDWCWDWDFGDMPARLAASDEQLFVKALHWKPMDPNERIQRVTFWFCGVLLIVVAVLATSLVFILRSHAQKGEQEGGAKAG